MWVWEKMAFKGRLYHYQLYRKCRSGGARSHRPAILSSGMIPQLGTGSWVNKWRGSLPRGWVRFLEVRYTTGLLKQGGRLGPRAPSRPAELENDGRKPVCSPSWPKTFLSRSLWDWALVSRRVGTTNMPLWGLPLYNEVGWSAQCHRRKPGLETGVLFASPASNAAIVRREDRIRAAFVLASRTTLFPWQSRAPCPRGLFAFPLTAKADRKKRAGLIRQVFSIWPKSWTLGREVEAGHGISPKRASCNKLFQVQEKLPASSVSFLEAFAVHDSEPRRLSFP